MTGPDLFAGGSSVPPAPLAVRMRPRTLDEVRGQDHVLAVGAPLRRLVEGSDHGAVGPLSAILWGPAGTGKTTLAHLVASAAGRRFVELSAVTAGVKDVREVMAAATTERDLYGRRTVLFLDEIHRFSKAQQDALLPGVENRVVILVAATTENPSFSVISPLLSRSVVVALRPLRSEDVRAVVREALTQARGLDDTFDLAEDALAHLVRLASGDARRALTTLEAAAGVATDRPQVSQPEAGVRARIELGDVELSMNQAAVRYDRAGDQHYDVASALIKSMRGSDPDAALHYLARMIEAGEDPRFIARRVVIAASEDVGMADPTALQTAVAALHAVAAIGMPEARIILAQAVVHVSVAPKSNAAYLGIDRALADLQRGAGGPVPAHLRSSGSQTAAYRYPHDSPSGVVAQTYLPHDLDGADPPLEYYRPTDRGLEARIAERLEWIRGLRTQDVSSDTPAPPQI